MKFGLTEEEFSLLTKILIEPMTKLGATLWIFGSRVRGDYKKFSDIDILYDTNNIFPTGAISKIKEDLEESRLPYKVDLVDVSDLAKSYAANINKEKIPLI
jgi:predicted nucleotidyltransferase